MNVISVLVSCIVTFLSIFFQKLITILQRCLRDRARARRKEVVEMQNVD